MPTTVSPGISAIITTIVLVIFMFYTHIAIDVAYRAIEGSEHRGIYIALASTIFLPITFLIIITAVIFFIIKRIYKSFRR